MCTNDKAPARHVTVVVADKTKLRELEEKRDADPDSKLPQVIGGAGVSSKFDEVCFEILADGETAGYLVERKWPTLEVFKLFIFSDFRRRDIAKKAVYKWRSRRLPKGFTHVQLEVDDESAGFWASVFPWYSFEYSGVHAEVPMEGDKDGFNPPGAGADTR